MIDYREIGCASPGAIDDQELLLYEQAVSDNSLRTAGTEQLGDRAQKMCEEYQQVLHDSEG